MLLTNNMKTNTRKLEAPNLEQTLSWWEKTNQEAATLARWICLKEAVDLIADKAEDRGLTINDVDLPPLAIMKYIEASETQMTRKILEQEYHINICANEDDTYKGEGYEHSM